jgi:hypothetical protein
VAVAVAITTEWLWRSGGVHYLARVTPIPGDVLLGLLDIALIPECRGQGGGGELIGDLLKAAGSSLSTWSTAIRRCDYTNGSSSSRWRIAG